MSGQPTIWSRPLANVDRPYPSSARDSRVRSANDLPEALTFDALWNVFSDAIAAIGAAYFDVPTADSRPRFLIDFGSTNDLATANADLAYLGTPPARASCSSR